jgi:hypothetical protein
MAETIDLVKNRQFDRDFRHYLESLKGGYAKLKEAYDFQVYRVPDAGEVVPAEPAAGPQPADARPVPPPPAAPPATPAPAPQLAPGAAPGLAPEPVPAVAVDPLAQWQASAAAFKAAYGRDTTAYRIKFKPTADKLKRQFAHINFYVGGATILTQITVAKADGDIIETHILALAGVNAPVADSVFEFAVPAGVTVENLAEE